MRQSRLPMRRLRRWRGESGERDPLLDTGRPRCRGVVNRELTGDVLRVIARSKRKREEVDGGSQLVSVKESEASKTPPASPISRLRTAFTRIETLKNVYSGRYSLSNFLPPVNSAAHSVCEAASTPR